MLTIRERHDLPAALASLPRPLALVATMGALHDGHRALVAAARGNCASVIGSVFVNPAQFNDQADFAAYPRDEAADLHAMRQAGCDAVWIPDVAQMYPPAGATTVDPAGPALRWEGTARPGHFRGMATIVTKLFTLLQPDDSYFGEKDWQQLQIVRRLVADLFLPVRIVGVETIREADGLAMSSRNRLLTPEERAIAPRLHACLVGVQAALRAGAGAASTLDEAGLRLTAAGFAVEYLALVEADTLEPTTVAAGSRVIAAARLGRVRLLDNVSA